MIVAVSGQISSGKSTLSRMLAARTGWERFSFGEYVAKCAERIGLDPEDRETLQDLGSCLSRHPEQFVRGFLGWTSGQSNMILDGVRHVAVLGALKTENGECAVKLVFVDTPSDVAKSRFDGDLLMARGHAVEAEIEKLKPLADWVLPDSSPESLRIILTSMEEVPEVA